MTKRKTEVNEETPKKRPPKTSCTEPAAKWPDLILESAFYIRYNTDITKRFDNVKNNQGKKIAYDLWATELSTDVGVVFTAKQVQRKVVIISYYYRLLCMNDHNCT